jgi:circadian clock protein KaiB
VAGYEFTIYIAGSTPRSDRAVACMRRLCSEFLPGDHRIDVVDVLADPERAELHNVIATPTVVRVSPAPERRVLGDLSDTARVRQALDIDAGQAQEALL